jgi:hypothetical protein
MIFCHTSCVAVVLSFKNGVRLRFAVHMVSAPHILCIPFHARIVVLFERINLFTGVEKTKISPPQSQYMES